MFIEDSIRDKADQLLNRSPGHMGHALGIEFMSLKQDEVKASMPVNEKTVQPFGILHGGASVALAETIASIGAWFNIDDPDQTAVGIEINANHIRAVTSGNKVIGTATPVHLGRQIHVWEAKIRTPDNKLVCISRCTLAIVDKS